MSLIPINTFKTIDALHQMQLKPSTSLGDIIEPLYDDKTGQIKVYFYARQSDYDAGTGKEIFKADTYLNGTAYIYTAIPVGQIAAMQICEGTTLVKFEASGSFPFYFKKTQANSYICTEKICDIAWIGLPKVSAAASASDTGRILVEAKSSVGGLQYWTEPFEYGAGAPSGEFFLLPGIYKIYAQDAQGCIISIGVEIPIGEPSETHFLKFFASYSNIKGGKTRIEILEKDYEGEAIQLGTEAKKPNPSNGPFVASWGKPGEEANHPLKVSEATLKLISYTDYEFLNFFVNESQKYKVKIKRGDEAGPLLWWGYITPEFYSEPYIHPPYEIQVLCNDGLGDLQKIPWALVAIDYTPISFYTGRLTHLQVVVECLKKIGNELPIYTAVNIYEENMGFTDGPKVLVHTFTTSVTQTNPTLLKRGVEYLFKIKKNTGIKLFYGAVLLYEGALPPSTLVNQEFTDDFRKVPGSWTQAANGFSSEVWGYTGSRAIESGGTEYLYNKAAIMAAGGPPKSNYLIQPYNFSAGGNYTLDVKLYRESFTGASSYKLKAGIGDDTGAIETVYDSGLFTSTEDDSKTYTATFSPVNNGRNFYFWLEFQMPSGTWGKFYIDFIKLQGTPPTSDEVEFTYTPEVNTDLLKIEIVTPGETTVEIWETIQDAFNQIYVDSENYIDKEVMNCFDVLEEQLKPYAARMYQSGGAWHIVRFDQQNLPYLRHKYDKNGEYILSETYEPILSIRNPSEEQDNIWIHANMNLEVLAGFRNVTTIQDLGWIENYIIGGDFPIEEFTLDGTLKHFTWKQIPVAIGRGGSARTAQRIPPGLPYKMASVSGDNYALHLLYDSTTPLIRVKGYVKGDSVPVGVPVGSEWQNADVSLFGHTTDPTKTGVYSVSVDELWKFFLGENLPMTGWYVRDYFTGLFWLVKRDLASSGGRSSYIFAVPDPSPEKLLTSEDTTTYWVKSMPRIIQYDTNDLLLLEIGYAFQSNAFPGKYFLYAEVKVGNMYWQQDGSFSTWYDILEFELSETRQVTKLSLTSTGFVGGQPLTDVEVSVKIWLSLKPAYANNGVQKPGNDWQKYSWEYPGGPLQAVRPSLVIDYIKLVYLPRGQYPPTETVRIMSNSKKFHTVPNALKLMHGDAPQVLNRDKIYSYYLTHSDGSLTNLWHRAGEFESKPLVDILTQILMKANLENSERITGTIWNLLSLNDVIYDPQNPLRLFMLNSISWDEMYHESNAELIEIEPIPPVDESAFTYGFSIGYES
jgi:hypothetical protein